MRVVTLNQVGEEADKKNFYLSFLLLNIEQSKLTCKLFSWVLCGEINFPPFPVWKLPVNIGSLVAILGDRKPGEPEGKNLAIARMEQFDKRYVQGKVFND